MLHVKSCRIVSTFQISNSLGDLMTLVNGHFWENVPGTVPEIPGNVPGTVPVRVLTPFKQTFFKVIS